MIKSTCWSDHKVEMWVSPLQRKSREDVPQQCEYFTLSALCTVLRNLNILQRKCNSFHTYEQNWRWYLKIKFTYLTVAQWVKKPFQYAYAPLLEDVWTFGHNKAVIIPIFTEWLAWTWYLGVVAGHLKTYYVAYGDKRCKPLSMLVPCIQSECPYIPRISALM